MTIGEVVLAEDRGRNRDVLHDAGQIREAQVDELATLILHQLQYFFGSAFLHDSSCGGAFRSNTGALLDGDTTSGAKTAPEE